MNDDQKPSWKELEAAHANQAAKSYVKELDSLFTASGRSEEAEALVKRLRDSHGTPELAEVCRTFREELGMPREIALLSIFLDSQEAPLVVEALKTMLLLAGEGDAEFSKGVQSQVRVLSQDFNNDIAEVAEDILAKLA